MDPTEPDIEVADGLIRRLVFGDDELVVVNVSKDALTVNWTTNRSAPQFVELTRHLPGYETATAVLCTAHTDLETDADELIRLAKDNDHSNLQSWDLVRLDLSETRSVAWERLPDEIFMVGFGDEADCLQGHAYGEAADQLFLLLELTRTSHIQSQEVVEHALELTSVWEERNAGSQDSETEPVQPEVAGFRERPWP